MDPLEKSTSTESNPEHSIAKWLHMDPLSIEAAIDELREYDAELLLVDFRKVLVASSKLYSSTNENLFSTLGFSDKEKFDAAIKERRDLIVKKLVERLDNGRKNELLNSADEALLSENK